MINEALLEEAFKMDFSLEEAANYAGISSYQLRKYFEEHPEFRTKCELLRNTPVQMARELIYKALEGGDLKVAQWLLPKKRKSEFSERSELTGADGTALGGVNLSINKTEVQNMAIFVRELLEVPLPPTNLESEDEQPPLIPDFSQYDAREIDAIPAPKKRRTAKERESVVGTLGDVKDDNDIWDVEF